MAAPCWRHNFKIYKRKSLNLIASQVEVMAAVAECEAVYLKRKKTWSFCVGFHLEVAAYWLLNRLLSSQCALRTGALQLINSRGKKKRIATNKSTLIIIFYLIIRFSAFPTAFKLLLAGRMGQSAPDFWAAATTGKAISACVSLTSRQSLVNGRFPLCVANHLAEEKKRNRRKEKKKKKKRKCLNLKSRRRLGQL